MSELPSSMSARIVAEAKAARRSQKTYTCSVISAYTTGNYITLSKKKRLEVNSFDLGSLIDSIEGLGWSLTSTDYVNVPATSGQAGAFGHSSTQYMSEIRAQLLFRAR